MLYGYAACALIAALVIQFWLCTQVPTEKLGATADLWSVGPRCMSIALLNILGLNAWEWEQRSYHGKLEHDRQRLLAWKRRLNVLRTTYAINAAFTHCAWKAPA